MKVKDFIGPFAEDQTFIVDGDYFTDEELVLLYGNYDVLKAKSYDDGLWLDLDISDCDCYSYTNELRYEQTEFGIVRHYEEMPICLGTPDKRPCDCEGYKSRCCLHKERKDDKDN